MRQLGSILLALALQQVGAQDLEDLLKKADLLLEAARTAYDEAKQNGSAAAFLEAGFKLEEVRIKYLVLQELGQGELPKIAASRLRACIQLQKLINDGKVAVSPRPASAPSIPPVSSDSRPADPAAPVPASAPPAASPAVEKAVSVMARPPVPDADRLKPVEKSVRDLFKEHYAKKGVADRRALGRRLLAEAGRNQSDPAAVWVLCREAIDVAGQALDVPTAIQAVEFAAEFLDVDVIQMKGAALSAMSKAAKFPDEAAAVADAQLTLVDAMVAADLFDSADKVVQNAVQLAKKAGDAPVLAKATRRSKEVSEAKSLFQSSKSTLETLAKKPDDPAANAEMGRFLCFVKGSWDLGLRFIVKGPPNPVRSAAERELALPTAAPDLAAVADAWADLAEKEKSTLRKAQMTAHARECYLAAFDAAEGLLRSRIEKRLGQLADPNEPPSLRSTRKITITKAVYSAGGKPFDVAGELQDAIGKTPGSPIRCDDYVVPGQTFFNQGKSMTVEGTIDGRPFKETFADGEIFVLPRLPLDGLAVPGASQRFLIVEAYLGKGTTWTDVTEIVRAKVTDPTQTVPYEITGLDPYPGTLKCLVLVFEIRGRRYLRWAAEKTSLVPMRK